MKAWIDSLKGQSSKKPLPLLSFPCVSLLGITVSELISSSDLQAKGMKAIADRTNAAAAVSFMDIFRYCNIAFIINVNIVCCIVFSC